MYRIFLFCLILFLGGCTHKTWLSSFTAEPTKKIQAFPFQVISSEQALNANSEPISTYDKIKLTETLYVSTLGHLILVHYTGKFLEFEGDTTITIKYVSEMIDTLLNLTSGEPQRRATIELLMEENRLNQSAVGAVSCPYSGPIEFLTPVSDVVNLSKNDPKICLSWKTTNPGGYEYFVTLKNIFDEPLDQFEANDGRIKLDLSDYFYDMNLFLVQILETTTDQVRALAIRLDREYVYVPRKCDPTTAIEALEMAFFQEIRINEESSLLYALTYYQLAADLSDHPFYDLMLENFKKRCGLK